MLNAVTKLFDSIQNATLLLFKFKLVPILWIETVAILLRWYSVYKWEYFYWRVEIWLINSKLLGRADAQMYCRKL